MTITTTMNGKVYTEKELDSYFSSFGWHSMKDKDIKEQFGQDSIEYKTFLEFFNARLKFAIYNNIGVPDLYIDNDAKNNKELKVVQDYVREKITADILGENLAGNYTYLSDLIFNDPKVWNYFKDFTIEIPSDTHSLKKLIKADGKIKTLADVKEENGSFIYTLTETFNRDFVLISMGFMDEEVTAIISPRIYERCSDCEKSFYLTFNHKRKAIVPALNCECEVKKQYKELGFSEDKFVSKVVTTGKLFICNDMRELCSRTQLKSFDSLHESFGKKKNIYCGLESIIGKNMYAYLYAHLFKAAYAMAGNHSCSVNKVSQNELLFTYDNEMEYPPISLSLWGIFVMDYADAVTVATLNNKMDVLKNMESNVVEVEPGTYHLVTDFKAQDGEVTFGEDEIEYFAKLIKVSDGIEPVEFNKNKFMNMDWKI